MKRNFYNVELSNGYTTSEYAFTKEEAVILAQAKVIQKGLKYDLVRVKEIK